MKGNYQDYMKLGIVHFMAYPKAMAGTDDMSESIHRIMADPDFGCIELTRMATPEMRKQARSWAAQSGTTVFYGAQPQLMRNKENLNSLDEEVRQSAVRRMKACIDEAEEMGAAGIAFLAWHYDPSRIEEHYQALVKSTCEIMEYAKEHGNMPVNLEVFDKDVEKCSLIGPAPLAKRFAEEINAKYDQFGPMVDLSHIMQLGESFEENLEPIRPYIRHAHLATAVLMPEAPAYGDQHPGFYFDNVVVTEDIMADFLRMLFKVGYLGEGKCPPVSFEIKPWGDEDSEMLIAGSKRFLSRAWELV